MLGVQHGLRFVRLRAGIDEGRARAVRHQHPVREAIVDAGMAGLQAAVPGDAGQALAGGQGSGLRGAGQRAGEQDLFGQRQGQAQAPGGVGDRQREGEVQAQPAVVLGRHHAAQAGLRQHLGHGARIGAGQGVGDGRVGGLREFLGTQFFMAHVRSLGRFMTRCAMTSSCTSVVPA